MITLEPWERNHDQLPSFVSSAVPDMLGASRTFRQWATDHAAAFTGAQAAG